MGNKDNLMENIDLTLKHRMFVPGLGVFIAPNAVARLFQLHDYTKCPNLSRQVKPKRVLYSILRSKCLLQSADFPPATSETI